MPTRGASTSCADCRLPLLASFLAFSLAAAPSFARDIGQIADLNLWQQTKSFWTLQDASVRYAVMASILLGLTTGILGSFMVVRKLSLIGDALGHAVLPGVCIGFLISGSKSSIWVFLAAVAAGLIGTYLLSAIHHTTRIKPDAAMAMILSSFFAVGICLLTYIQQLPIGNKAGLDSFLFGQAAAVGPDDLVVMGIASAIVLLVVAILFKEFVATSFDAVYARTLGLPTALLHHVLMALLALTVVISIRAVGVILVAAMLIIPAATAYLLVERMRHMVVVAAVAGVISGVLGAYLSFLGTRLPTGPFMVVAAATVFLAAYLFAPRHGTLTRWFRFRRTRLRTELENTLKAAYHVREHGGLMEEVVGLDALAHLRGEPVEEARRRVGDLVRYGLAVATPKGFQLTRDGFVRACEVVRNHRLWELYLVSEASIAPDHVHEDAEKIEHVLGEDVVRKLEKKLQYPRYDPHGKPIPSLRDLELSEYLSRERPRAPQEVLLGRYRTSEGIKR